MTTVKQEITLWSGDDSKIWEWLHTQVHGAQAFNLRYITVTQERGDQFRNGGNVHKAHAVKTTFVATDSYPKKAEDE